MSKKRNSFDLYAEESIACILGEPLSEKERTRLIKNRQITKEKYSPINSTKKEYVIDRDIAYFLGSELTAEEISEIYSRN